MKTFKITLSILLLFLIAGRWPVSAQTDYVDTADSKDGGIVTTFATTDSRMVATIKEVGDEVFIEVLSIGYIRFGTVTTTLQYDANVVVPIKGTGGAEITAQTTGYANMGAFVNVNPDLSSYWSSSSGLSGGIYPTVATKYVYVKTGPDPNAVPREINEAGNILPLFTMHFKKKDGQNLSSSTFLFYEKTSVPASNSQYVGPGLKAVVPANGNGTSKYTDAGVFQFRIPASVSTAAILAANIDADNYKVTVKGVADSRGLTKREEGKGLDWDKISKTGFIYSKNNVALSLDEYSKKMKINGTEVDFPTDTEIAAKEFSRTVSSTDYTFNIVETVNTAEATSVNMTEQLEGLTPNVNYYVYAYMKYNFQTSNEYPAMGEQKTFKIVPCPVTSKWLGTNTDWTDTDNWNNGVPGSCTEVTIPGELAYYPILEEEDNAICKSIYFQFGGEVAHLEFLTYQTAKVDLTLDNNRWYMLASPLQHMYSGDYYLYSQRTNPKVWMQQYQTANPELGTAATAGEWNKAFNNLNMEFKPGMGYVVYVDDDTPDRINTFTFPRTEMSYGYFDSKTGVGDAEKTDDIISTRANSAKLAFDKTGVEATGKISLNVYGDMEGQNTAIFGNPMMSHLDFWEFSQHPDNIGKIEPKYYIWNGTTFSVSMQNISTGSADKDKYIAPMQSFIISKKVPANLIGSLSVTGDMSVINTGEGATLRAAENSANPQSLKLDVLRSNELQSSIAIAYDPNASNSYRGEEDAWTLFNQSVKAPAVLYSLIDGKAASINTLSDLGEIIPLGIRTTKKGELTLKLEDAKNSPFTVELEDREVNYTVNLNKNSYSFNNTTGNIENRFFLHIKRVITGIDTPEADNGITVYYKDGAIHAVSHLDDPIRSLEVTGTNGQVIGKLENIDKTQASYPLNSNLKVVIVKVKSGKSVQTKKIVL